LVVYRLAPIHRPSPSSTSTPEVRVLSSVGVTRPQRSYDPVRLPPTPTSCDDVEAATLVHAWASPNYPAHPSNMPSPIPRWTGTGASVGCFPIPRGPSPFLRRVGVHHFTFEACSGFRGRDGHCWPPPAQIRTCPTKASGSYLGCLTSKRMSGQGCRMHGWGSQSSTNFVMRSHVNPPF